MPESQRTATESNNGNGFSRSLLRDMVDNAMLARSELMERYFDPRRNLNDECGYPETRKIQGDDYRDLYDRDPIAARVVEILPYESWMLDPSVIEDEDVETITKFEGAFYELPKSLEGEESWYEDEQENSIWSYLLRADILSRIGWYGTLLLGIDDGKPLSEPAESKKDQRLIYLRPFDSTMSVVSRWETDSDSSRFGWPAEYSITFVDTNNAAPYGLGVKNITEQVHWSRVIHICNKSASSNVVHTPPLQHVLNRVLDLRKLYAGSAEMYWRGAFPGISFEVAPQLLEKGVGIGSTRRAAIRSEIENYMNGLQRYLTATGLTAKSLPTQVVDPSPQIEVQLTAICILLDIPKRIFMGSERGELSSSQDAVDWLRNLNSRQRRHNTPNLIVPFVNRCISLGILPKPKSYKVTWPDMLNLSPEQRATIAEKRIKTMAAYVGGNVEAIMSPIDLYTRELDYDSSEAEQILDSVEGQEFNESMPPQAEEVILEEMLQQADEALNQIGSGPISGQPIGGEGEGASTSSDLDIDLLRQILGELRRRVGLATIGYIDNQLLFNISTRDLLMGILGELRKLRGEKTLGYREEDFGGSLLDETVSDFREWLDTAKRINVRTGETIVSKGAKSVDTMSSLATISTAASIKDKNPTAGLNIREKQEW